MGDYFDGEASELVFPGSGRIPVNADSVFEALGLPKTGHVVSYVMNDDAIAFIDEKFGLDDGHAPSVDSIVQRLKNNKTTNDDFLRSLAHDSNFNILYPPTGQAISPTCYPAIMDLKEVSKLNWCQFVVDQLKVAVSNKGENNLSRDVFFVPVVRLMVPKGILWLLHPQLSASN